MATRQEKNITQRITRLEKELTVKNRSLEIESAVERVRAKALAMHKSEEISNVVNTLRNELDGLKIPGVAAATITLQQENGNIRLWDITSVVELEDGFHFNMDIIFSLKNTKPNDWIRKIWDGKGKYFVYKQDKKSFKRTLAWTSKYNPEFADNARRFLEANKIKNSWHPVVPLSHGKLSLDLLQEPVAEVESILKKMAAAFDLAYKRFLDLQKAEAQTKEAQIEAALERVRSRTMAMHQTSELQEVIHTVHKELLNLNLSIVGGSFVVINDDVGPELRCWGSGGTANTSEEVYVPHFNMPFCTNLMKGIKGRPGFFTEEFSQKEKKEYFTKLFKHKPWSDLSSEQKKETLSSLRGYTRSVSVSKHTTIFIINHHGRKFTEAENDILKRFAKVFEQTYTRFLDLQKAEAQARESQIQLALERVRARTMAMQRSDELAETASLLFKQINDLGIQPWTSGFNIWEKDDRSFIGYNPTPSGGITPPYQIPSTKDSFFKKIYVAKKRGDDFLVFESAGKSLAKTYNYMKTLPVVKDVLKSIEGSGFQLPTFQINHCAFFSHGFLLFITLEAYLEAHDIFKRFAKVFEQTYIRFLDLQKAEAQAKESMIETALERIRARALAMHSSNELMEVAKVLREQLSLLGQPDLETSVVHLYEEDPDHILSWRAFRSGTGSEITYGYIAIPKNSCEFVQEWLTNYYSNSIEYTIEISGAKQKEWYDVLFKFAPDVINAMRQNKSIHEKRYHQFSTFSGGALLMVSRQRPSEESIYLQRRAALVFDLAYRRFLDLKKAEAQARESQIQLALERVRARTMAMQRSDELQDSALMLFQQVTALGVPSFACGFNIWSEDKKYATAWMAGEGRLQPPFRTSSSEDVFLHIHEAAQRGEELFVVEQGGKVLETHYRYMASIPVFRDVMEKMTKAGLSVPTFQIIHCAFFSQGYLMFISFDPVPEAHDIFKRFAKVFEQTYTRFLDLQKAEAQVREAKIEAGLERVRSRAMAMQSSNELKELIVTVSSELGKLDFILDRCFINIIDTSTMGMTWWMCHPESAEPIALFVKYHEYKPYLEHLKAWKERQFKFEYILEGSTKKKWDKFLFTETDLSLLPEIISANMKAKKKVYLSSSFNNFGYLSIATLEPLSNEQFDIMLRFAKVFDLTYTRFNDLKQAEAQAKEAQIELGLERVRSRAMAMQSSEELNELIGTVFTELTKLDLVLTRCVIWVFDPATNEPRWWMANSEEPSNPMNFLINYHEHPAYLTFIHEWKKQNVRFVYDLKGQDKTSWDDILFNETELVNLPDVVKNGMRAPERVLLSASFNNFGGINVASLEPLSDEHFDILLRFAKVFDLTYTRFNDLKQAEEQAKESRVQLALERVRARTMAMQKSNELMETAVVLFNQLNQLGENIERTIIGVMNEEEGVVDVWATRPDGSQMTSMQKFPIDEPIVMQRVYAAWRQQKKSIVIDLKGEELERYFQFLKRKGPLLKRESLGERRVENFVFFSKGILGVINADPNTPANLELYERFAAVFDQTYTRFLDLQKAEAQARESQIQLALERVRARTMAMQKSEELPETSHILFEQMKELGEPVEQLTIGVVQEENKVIEISATLHGDILKKIYQHSLDEPFMMSKIYHAWKTHQKTLIVELKGDELNAYNKYRNELTKSEMFPTNLGDEHRRIVYAAFFSKGMLALGANEPRPPESLQLLERFAGVFDQAYIRFIDLKNAEAQAREAQIEAGLERVRSRAMAMHKTDELLDAAELIYKELSVLGITSMNVSYAFVDEQERYGSYYSVNPVDGKTVPFPFVFPHTETEVMRSLLSSWKKQEPFHVIELDEETTLKHQTYIGEQIQKQIAENNPEIPFSVAAFLEVSPKKAVIYNFNFPQGYIFIIGSSRITTEQEQMVLRFTKVFELTYRRFLDLKQAEAQTREAQIELALERVRARTMAMHRSEELAETAQVMFHQLQELGGIPDRIAIGVADEANGIVNFWSTDQTGGGINKNFKGRLNERTVMSKAYKAWKENDKSLVVDLHGDDVKEWLHFARKEMGIAVNIDQIKDRRVHSFAFFSHGWILVTTHEPQSAETIQILERFASVFNLTYRRFLDLQTAEAQANEARIEISLERIRARALAMHKSDELIEVAKVMREQMALLGQAELEASAVHLYEQDSENIHSYRAVTIVGTDSTPKLTYGHMAIPKKSCEFVGEWITNFYSDLKEYTIELSGQRQDEWYDVLFKLAPEVVNTMRQGHSLHEKRYYKFSKFSGGALLMITKQEPSEEATYLQRRAAVVFDLAYRRFTDLQKAEAQAREAQIETALERVRSRSLAMHKSDELQEVVNTVFERLQELDVEMDSCNIAIFKEGTRDFDYWIASPVQRRSAVFHVPYMDLYLTKDLINARESGAETFSRSYSFEEKNEWFDYAYKHSDFNYLPDERKKFVAGSEGISFAIAFAKNTGVQINRFLKKLPSDSAIDILKRFSKVFEQAYIRFLDLQKAEAQAREAQIEAALERVRAKAMAMHKSEDLNPAVAVVFEELEKLNSGMLRCGIGIYHKATRSVDVWLTSKSDHENTVQVSGGESVDLHPLLQGGFDAWLKHEDFSYVLQGEDMIRYYNTSGTGNVRLPDSQLILSDDQLKDQYFNLATFQEGNLFAVRESEFSEEARKVMKRFAGVFELTYKRFLDLQKAEANAREAQIEASLERVRGKAMAMHKSQDLQAAVAIVFEELDKLNLGLIRCGIAILDKEKPRGDIWITIKSDKGKTIQVSGDEPMDIHPLLLGAYNAWLKQEDKSYVLQGDDLVNYYRAMGKTNFQQEITRSFDVEKKDQVQYHFNAVFQNGSLFAFLDTAPTDEARLVIKRFANVFNLTYKRFLDLQKAEASAREAQIEASLERVRSKTMAMHNSQDVAATVATMFDEFVKLDVETIRCGITIIHDNKQMEVWTANLDESGKVSLAIGNLSMTFHKMPMKVYECWKNKETHTTYELIGEELKDYFRGINNAPDYPTRYDIDKLPYRLMGSAFYFPEGALFAFTQETMPVESSNILKRFAGVFGQTYRRYLDLQKAEANAKEAQIEAGLERVRARTMAMHNSEDVSTATATMFVELEKLGIENFRGGITNIFPNRTQDVWSVNNLAEGKVIKAVGVFNIDAHPFWQQMFKEWQEKKDFTHYYLGGQDREEYVRILNANQDYLPQALQQFPDVHFQVYYFNEGAVWTNSLHPHSEEEKQIMKRFVSVFSLTFRRYQDLKKAEAQAREATIEAALEKVRGKAMAMHDSTDLSVTTSMIITELRKLGIKPLRCGVGILNKETNKAQLYTATSSPDGDSLSVIGWVLLEEHPVLKMIYEKWLAGEDYFPELSGDSRRAYYERLLAGLSVPVPDFKDAKKHYGHFFSFSVGCLYAWSDVRYNEDEIKILKRFATIIDLTFRRYFELQKSEENAKEAVKQAALDRIRAEIASMRTIEDLDRITPLIWNELTILGIPFIRCGVFLMDDSQQLIHTFLSTPDGKAIAAFHLPYETPGNFADIIDHWRNKKTYVNHWNESDFLTLAETLVNQGAIANKDQYLKTLPRGGFYLHFLPFLQGMLYVGNTERLNDEEIELIQHVADAFSTAYARYEDFNRLEAAKQQVENTLTDLKQAQQQLVQSEKMASLGELTAGIAHEIQNPLNFVNNFSDVSNELLEEMKTELEKGNKEDAIAIVEDVKQNLEKILHHGKRADAIVKGMLQHSRTSSGQKEMTDINILADEYLRLAYHGLRAKDKSFNAKFETHFDNSIGRINVIPQDIGRVVLNLINNAFYTVTEKKRLVTEGYEPTVTVTTHRDNGRIEIKVKDNGNGIPQKLLDKIFQPFFTTKPTGQGTGLGLSLAYDIIIKGHGGELKVETKEGEGSEFVIQLPG